MSFKSFFNAKVKKLNWLDLALIKWSCIAFGIILASLIPVLTEISVWYFVVIAILLAIRPLYRAYIK